MASATKRLSKSGEISYDLRISRGYDENGKRLPSFHKSWKPEKCMTEKQIAKELERQKIAFENEVKNLTSAGDNQMRFSRLCDLYLESAKTFLSAQTLENYRSIIEKSIRPAFGNMKIRDIRPAYIQRYIKQLSEQPKSKGNTEETLSAATIKRRLAIVQSIFRFAVKQGFLGESPALTERLCLPKVVQPKTEIFTKQEVNQMLSCIESEPLQYKVLIYLALFLGCRRGELIGLRFSDVDFVTSKITIARAAYKLSGQAQKVKFPKDNEIREIAASPFCIDLIQELKLEKEETAKIIGTQWHEGDWLFTQWNGEQMSLSTPSHWFSDFLKKNGLPHRKFHALRHTSATLLLYGGTDLKVVQNRLGHGNIKTTSVYLHCVEEADSKAASCLENVLGIKSKNSTPLKIKA